MDNNNINLSPERRAKWEASGEGEAFNAMVREKAKKLAEKMKAEQNGISGAMSNAAKEGSNRLAAEAARVRKERNEQAKQLEQRREARMAKFAAMKPRGGSRKRKTRKTRKTRKHRR
jgi:hypothetical protein